RSRHARQPLERERVRAAEARALVLGADAADDDAAARGTHPLAPLALERLLLQAGEEHRVADRHRQCREENDLWVMHHQRSSSESSVVAREGARGNTTPDASDRIRACTARLSRGP